MKDDIVSILKKADSGLGLGESWFTKILRRGLRMESPILAQWGAKVQLMY